MFCTMRLLKATYLQTSRVGKTLFTYYITRGRLNLRVRDQVELKKKIVGDEHPVESLVTW